MKIKNPSRAPTSADPGGWASGCRRLKTKNSGKAKIKARRGTIPVLISAIVMAKEKNANKSLPRIVNIVCQVYY